MHHYITNPGDCKIASFKALSSPTELQLQDFSPGFTLWEQHVRHRRFQQVERRHRDKGLFTSRIYFL